LGINTHKVEVGIKPEPKVNTVEDVKIRASHFIAVQLGSVHEVYRIAQPIGDGAFGTVSMAVHRATKTRRAVKTIKKSLALLQANAEQFV
jgi:hypothetical protein